ncbi:MAG: alpha/beta hydrolase [Candidatus Nanopelagicales bacterium]|jgi:pimeloyl-ACP methyl ester carboxylesterase
MTELGLIGIRNLAFGAVTVLLIAGCSSTNATAPSLPPNQPGQATPTQAGLEVFYSQQIDWRNCGDADCTTFEVPLDYQEPQGDRVTLSMSKVRARGESIGSLFVNPGGPGGSAFEYAKAADYIVTDQVRESFDVVGVDPRGVGFSDTIRCLTDEQIDALISADGSPDTELEESRLILDAGFIGQACENSGNPLIAHMSTVEVAKDMDIARALVGDPVMNLLGKSYGTAIGTAYLELFPSRVGRMVLDGVLPIYLNQFEVTQSQAEEFEVLLRYFVVDCLEQNDCPLTGSVDQGVQQIREFLLKLDAIPLVGDQGRELTEGLATFAILSYLYFPQYDFPELRAALSSAMTQGDPRELLKLLDQRISREPEGRYTDNSSDAFYAVSCLDLPVTQSVDQVREFAERLAISAPTFGKSLGWGVLACKDWPYSAQTVITITPNTSAPVMLVTAENDPATPAKWATDVAVKLGNAELVIWEGGYSHTAYLEGSDCVTDRVDAYLLEGIISPGTTTTCN